MKKEYNFSKGERGKFYRPDAELYLPIYIEPDMMEVLRKFSKKKGVEVATIVNEGEIGVASTHCTKTDISPSQLQPLLMSMADFQDIQV